MAMRRRKGSVPLFCALAAAACFSLPQTDFTLLPEPFPQKASALSGRANRGGGGHFIGRSWAKPGSCRRRPSAPPTQLNAWPQLRAVIQRAMHAVPNRTADIRDIRDFSLAVAGFVVSGLGFVVSGLGLAFTYASSDFRMKRLAVKKFMAPYEPAKSPDEVVPRKVVDDIRHRLSSWRQQSDATIVSGRYKSGKTVAVEEALRGVCGVWAFTVEVEDWKPAMYRMLGVKDANMFAEVLRRVRAKLQKKKFAKNLTQYPILLLDIPRDTKGGKEEGMKLVSTTAKDMSSDSRYAATAHVLVAASAAASALAFDAGGRRFDIWVGDMTEKEASELLKMHEHESAATAIIDNCGHRAGDLVDACSMLKRGINLSDIKVDFHNMAEKDVVNFMSLILDGKQVGQQILNALLQSGGAGIKAVINTTAYEPRKIAKLIRDENAHAIIWHPTEKLYRFASSLHATIAKQKMP
ncbi:unnamed protein product [Effrenium voratum]|uniref:Uncharacterized protein n=1 Tax=Effrenium voratum TaxID=2562239 RepID=A0AA36IMZ8_9DINO|nr:unnamed protein product [Effrenium voratum]